MGIERGTGRTGFYQELIKDNRQKFMEIKEKKYLPYIDTLYYSVYIKDDSKILPSDSPIIPLIKNLATKKDEVINGNSEIEFSHGLLATLKTAKGYNYCLTEPDLYDIFVAKTLTNKNNPRIQIQLRSLGLWTRGIEEIMIEAYKKLDTLLESYNLSIERCRETRIDYCYHTNDISNPNKIFKEADGCIKHLHTNLEKAKIVADLEHVEDGTIFHKNYVSFGDKKSKNVRARIYDKVKEVIELGYKGFFFKIWYDNGLISYYDKWCMEYALPYKNIDYLYKARLAFYVEHGKDTKRRERYISALTNKNTTLAEFRLLADEKIEIGDSNVLFLPRTTSILNVEYETKRKFYYYSDDFIDNFKFIHRDIPKHLERIIKILDNRVLFLEYLTKKSLSFHNGKDSNGNIKYQSWWERLRKTKLGGIKADKKLLREYIFHMDKKCVQKRAINALASVAVYGDKTDSGFIEDVSDWLAGISDNDAQRMGRLLYVDADGEVADELQGNLLRDYKTVKAKKERQIRNRKNQKEISNFPNVLK